MKNLKVGDFVKVKMDGVIVRKMVVRKNTGAEETIDGVTNWVHIWVADSRESEWTQVKNSDIVPQSIEDILLQRWDLLKEKYVSVSDKKMKSLYFAALSEVDTLRECFGIEPFYEGDFNDYMKTLIE